ncbi:MAG: dienelactone hydrolase family protein [Chloroflexi bacterium]|nr:dienelactone hydrolase family protein [Chloroflexota bacterium]
MCHPEVPAGTPVPDVATRELWVELESGERMPAMLALPDRTPAPAVIVLTDMYGRSPFYDVITRRLAQAGFVALQPDYYFREGPLAAPTFDNAMARRTALQGSGTLRDLLVTLRWLASVPEATGRLGTIGFCGGGTFVLQLAAERKDLASVCYYGFPRGHGDPPKEPPAPVEITHKMTGPILGFWGDQDQPCGIQNVQALRSGLQAAAVKHEFHIYPGLGHGFLKQFLEDDEAEGYVEACASWTRTLDFYRKRLA